MSLSFRWTFKSRTSHTHDVCLPPSGLNGAPLWRIRGPVGLPLSSNRPFFPGGGRLLRSGLPALRSGLSWVMGLSPPLSILLHTPRGAPASEKESGGIK